MSYTRGQEQCRPAFDKKPTPRFSSGLPFEEACAKHVEHTFKAARIFILASRSLSKQTDSLEKLKGALGDRVAGCHIGISPHTPISEVVEVIDDVRKLDVDCLVTLGAGSITDAAKLVRFAIANSAWDEKAISTLWGGHSHNPTRREHIIKPTIPMICIPTSLSGGEYQAIAGATETLTTRAKRTFEPGVDPELVILDPELVKTTPQWVWLSTGIRSVDHCVETVCSLQSTPEGDAAASRGLDMLVRGLLRSKANPDDSEGRYLCQLGVVQAMQAVSTGTPLGASHAIGHQLGPLGVGHGETSCILLPAVCKFNAAKGANNARQAMVRELLLGLEPVQAAIKARGREANDLDLGDILDIVIGELGMPRSLRAVNVGRDKFGLLAVNSLHDLWIKTNAFPITEEDQVLEILNMVAG
ncbi:alcohol dehydrogenase [Cladophialophora yegresii CBS 114405]|uniref:Alcohol dehydrogenase n=1 Tax=Cladophialophora yegresii CBS 114405 TaxID=1182544 RepID=W9VYR5_9EURO|nr:alcohol dehydrogenase [Cladophialophora yegresii CBS 114405]EXJ57386.1 alcohol dehydrogenase [Cladophialophora yegresii CBS 114405]